MAVKGSGTVARSNNPDPPMVEQTHYDARSGAGKRTQTDYPTKWGMKDQTTMSRVGPGMAPGGKPDPTYHFGPDASSANPSDPETPAERGKTLRHQPGGVGAMTNNGDWVPGKLNAAWGMVDADGKGVDNSVGGRVLGEAILSGSTKLPDSVSAKTDSGAAPKPWPSEDKGG